MTIDPDSLRDVMAVASKANQLKDEIEKLGGKMQQANGKYTIIFPAIHEKDDHESTGGPYHSFSQASSFVYGYRMGLYAVKRKEEFEGYDTPNLRKRRSGEREEKRWMTPPH